MIYHIFNSSLISGPETLVMPAIATMKPDVTVILLRESRIPAEKQSHVESYIKSLGLPFEVIEVRSRYDRVAFDALRKLLADGGDRLEVVHAHDVKASFYLYMATRKMKRRSFSLVSTHHGIDGRVGVINRLYELFYSYVILPKFNLALTVCTQDRDKLLRRGLSQNLVRVHLNGVTRVKISPAERRQRQLEIQKSWGLTQPVDCVIGVAARLENEKRPFEIIQIVQKMTELAPSFEFLVLFFGSGSLQKKLEQKTNELGLQKRLRWMGYRAGLGNEFAGFDILLSLSKAEGLPINLLEAGWAGTPIFATAVHGINDLVGTRNFGTLVRVDESTSAVANKLLEFAQNRKRLLQNGEAFQNHVIENFSQEVWLNSLMQFYKQLSVKQIGTSL